MSDEVDTFLAHYGVKGMRWGVKKASGSSGGNGGAARPSRKELRGMNKAARKRQRAEREEKMELNDAAIKKARADRQSTKKAIGDARKQYRQDKKMVGSVAAREVFARNTEKPFADLAKSAELTSGEAVVSELVGFGLTLVSAGLK